MIVDKLIAWITYALSDRDPAIRTAAIKLLKSHLDDEGKEFVLGAMRLDLRRAQTDKTVVQEKIQKLEDEIADLQGGKSN